MALRSDWSERPCPIARAIDTLGDPWTLLILREITYGVHRFEDIKEHTEATDKTLSDRLQRMLQSGLISRCQYSGTVRPRYEYVPTPAAHDALPLLNALALWGAEHTEPPALESRFKIICRDCNNETDQAEHCSVCRSLLTHRNTQWNRPTLQT